jgi:hypothetical protein
MCRNDLIRHRGDLLAHRPASGVAARYGPPVVFTSTSRALFDGDARRFCPAHELRLGSVCKAVVVLMIVAVTVAACGGPSSSPSNASSPRPTQAKSPSTSAETPVSPARAFLVNWSAGHFKARFLHKPVKRAVSAPWHGHIERVFDVEDPAARTDVRCVEMPMELNTPQDIINALAGVMDGLSRQAGFVLDKAARTTYEGHVAGHAEFHDRTGHSLTALGFGYTSTRLYVLLAPTSDFPDLLKSFLPLQ